MKSSTLKAKIQMLDMGIVPAMTGKELTSMLSSLSPEDRKIAKRKFRKQWRKLLKKNPDLRQIIQPEKGVNPNRSQLRSRAVFLISSIVKNLD